MRTIALFISIVPLLLAAATTQPSLPNTQALTLEGDIASHLVAGVDRFLLGELERSPTTRPRHWMRNFASPEAYNESIKPNRARLAHILGLRDARVAFDAPQLVTSTTRPSLIAKTDAYEVHAIRYPTVKDVEAEGLLLIPAKPVGIDVVAIPDADVLPEHLVGMAPGLAAEAQFARRLAESGCRVVVPLLIDRRLEKRQSGNGGGAPLLTTREFLYRPAFELGRHVIGYEVHKVLAAVDWFAKEAGANDPRIGVIGHGEGGLLALCAAALDTRIDAAVVSGYFEDRRNVWQQPIDRNIFSFLDQFGDAELASMVAPRMLFIEAAKGPEVRLPSQGGAPAVLVTPNIESVRREFIRAIELVVPYIRGTPQTPVKEPALNLMLSGDGTGLPGTEQTLGAFLAALKPETKLAAAGAPAQPAAPPPDGEARRQRQIDQIIRHTQRVLADSPTVRRQFLGQLDSSSLEKYQASVEAYRQFFRTQVIGQFNQPLLAANPRSRKFGETEKWVAHEVVLDVFPDVIAYGILIVPKDIKEGEKRPVVVCQHGLEGRPQHTVGKEGFDAYKAFAAQLADRGFITFAPQNLYIFTDRFRTLQRKANPLGKTLFSIITPQHQQIINFLKTLPNVDPKRIGFYGLSYGGKTAMRVPALLTEYALSICSADFNEWVWKNASTSSPYSYVFTGEYEIFEFDLGSTFNYAEMAALIAPRPFMVERGHFDGVAPDETVAYEFGKVRNIYNARLKLPPDRCQIEWFVGPHTINGQGTFDFLHHHLNWPKQATQPATKPATAGSAGPPAVAADHPAATAKGLDSVLSTLRAPTRDTKPLAPDEAVKQLRVREGAAVDLLVAEPVVRQPLNLTFDERGRLWVTQYAQYPFPKGLKVVEYDRYIRAKFDKVPPPPPNHDKGADKITIHEDTDGDGRFDQEKTFVDGLNIATSALPGRGGVWVLNPPYLLFYPDKNRDDVPDGDPVVHLSGFGLEDTHAVASSLMWGPDGWLYGAHGSTCTAKIRAPLSADKGEKTTDFLGQAIWRYHPERHVFEIFAEGGGNTFGVEFDDQGRLFSGTNWGNYRGVHYVQGGYYVKGWGKHGPLTNPHAYGFFEHMPHSGNADRLTHTYIVYGGDAFPNLVGRIVGPNPLMSRVDVTRFEPQGSTFKTVEEEDLLTSKDGWFRPVDLKAGPDGALYVADFYENRISHVDPRDNWERGSGRIYRIRPREWTARKAVDLSALPSAELVQRLRDKDKWIRQTALRLLHDRKDASVAPALKEMLTGEKGQTALEALWALNAVGRLDEESAKLGMTHADAHVRAWTVRLISDRKEALPESVGMKLEELAREEREAGVRSQLASSAKRLPANQVLPVIRAMLGRDDSGDPHIPLLLWWAVESKAISERDAVLRVFATSDVWSSPVARNTILPRLARRYAAEPRRIAIEPREPNQMALLRLLQSAPSDAERAILFGGIKEAFEGAKPDDLMPELTAYLLNCGDVELEARAGSPTAYAAIIESLRSVENGDQNRLIRRIQLASQLRIPAAADALLDLARATRHAGVRSAAITSLSHFEQPELAAQIIALYPKLDATLRAAALSTLTSRGAWTVALLREIERGAIARADLTADHLARIRDSEDRNVTELAVSVLGQLQKSTSQDKQNEIERIRKVLAGSPPGDAKPGLETFTARCATCHILHGKGASTGPNLTNYDRSSVDFLVLNTVDPSSFIREEYTQFRIKTRDRQTHYGLVAERNANQLVLMDPAGQKTTLPRADITDERALAVSIMPEDLLAGLSDQQLRDLFAYLMK